MNFDYPTFIEQTKQRFETLLNPKTFWIHFDGDEEKNHYRILTIENLSYVLVLLHSHHKEAVQQAFDRLKALLNFYVFKVGFCETLHDFPQVKSFSDQLLILAILKKIYEKYGKYAKEELQEHLHQVIEDLSFSLKEKITHPHHIKKWKAIHQEEFDIKGMQASEIGQMYLFFGVDENVLKFFDPWTSTFYNPDTIQKRERMKEVLTPYHLLALFLMHQLEVEKVPNSLLRYLPLFDQEDLKVAYPISHFKKALVEIDRQIQVKFPHDYSIYISSLFDISIEKQEEGLFILSIDYGEEPLDEKETICETEIFFSKKESFNLLAGEKKVTTFSIDEKVRILDKNQNQIGSISIEGEQGTFMGTIYFGNRPNQKIKTFEPFDRVLGIRTVKRKEKGKIKIFFRFDPLWAKGPKVLLESLG